MNCILNPADIRFPLGVRHNDNFLYGGQLFEDI